LPFWEFWPYGEEANFVAENAAKALTTILKTKVETLNEDSLRRLAHLPHKQKKNKEILHDITQICIDSFIRIKYKVEKRQGPDCRNVCLLAKIELSKRGKIRLNQTLA
jgi:hypothetical protein